MIKKTAIVVSLSFVLGFVLPFLIGPLLPPGEKNFSYAAIASSFILNLIALAFALATLPDASSKTIFSHAVAWLISSAASASALAGLFLSPTHHESWRVFAVLAFLFSAQAATLTALHAAASLIFGMQSRAPRTICALVLMLCVTALFWTREPIQRLSRSGNEGAEYSSYAADAVMKLSPPAAVAAVWYQHSNAVRASESGDNSSRKFDLVHGTLTYAVWIGSYQAVPTPEIMFSGSNEFYARRDFSPGVALTLLSWAIPLMLLCDLLLSKTPLSTRDREEAELLTQH